jgi:hypothetical protein
VICYRCACDVLPRLIADAMRAKGRSTKLLCETRDRILERFFHAAALAMASNLTTKAEAKFERRMQNERIAFAFGQHAICENGDGDD